jgi:hypothetical protein
MDVTIISNTEGVDIKKTVKSIYIWWPLPEYSSVGSGIFS